MFADADSNSDQKVSKDEFLKFGLLDQEFAQFDTDKDGSLVMSEFLKWHEKDVLENSPNKAKGKGSDSPRKGKRSKSSGGLRESSTSPDADRDFEAADTDGDGKVSREEYTKKDLEVGEFDYYDADKDKFFTRSEWGKWFKEFGVMGPDEKSSSSKGQNRDTKEKDNEEDGDEGLKSNKEKPSLTQDWGDCDVDNDGKVTEAEFIATGFVKGEFAEFDQNKDAVLDRKEFEGWWAKYGASELGSTNEEGRDEGAVSEKKGSRGRDEL